MSILSCLELRLPRLHDIVSHPWARYLERRVPRLLQRPLFSLAPAGGRQDNLVFHPDRSANDYGGPTARGPVRHRGRGTPRPGQGKGREGRGAKPA